jgi:hypothetical protein
MEKRSDQPTINAAGSQPAYLCEKQVARRLGFSVKWLQKLRYQGGGIPYHKFGGRIRYAIADLVAYEAANRRLNSSDQPSAPLYTHYLTYNGEMEGIERLTKENGKHLGKVEEASQ